MHLGDLHEVFSVLYLLRPKTGSHAEHVPGEVGGAAEGGAGPQDGHIGGRGPGGMCLTQQAGQQAGPVHHQAGQRHHSVPRGYLHQEVLYSLNY